MLFSSHIVTAVFLLLTGIMGEALAGNELSIRRESHLIRRGQPAYSRTHPVPFDTKYHKDVSSPKYARFGHFMIALAYHHPPGVDRIVSQFGIKPARGEAFRCLITSQSFKLKYYLDMRPSSDGDWKITFGGTY